jgi:hypothetical protein
LLGGSQQRHGDHDRFLIIPIPEGGSGSTKGFHGCDHSPRNQSLAESDPDYGQSQSPTACHPPCGVLYLRRLTVDEAFNLAAQLRC